MPEKSGRLYPVETHIGGIVKHFNVALLGFGTVGSGVYRIVNENGAQIAHREGIELSVSRILVRDFEHEPNLDMAPRALFTTSFDEIISDPAVDIVVECMGGIEPAKTFIIRALEAGKTVVTSNKEVMSKNWPVFEKAAKATGAGLYLEATVGGGIPIIRTILDSMQANNITRVMGIINGTTNYILTQMTENGQSFEDALADAQTLGYAEANPTADVEGYDAMYKLSILSSMSFHAHMPIEVIYREGITKLTKADFETAALLDYRIKLLAIGKETGGAVEARVHPTMIPFADPLSSVSGSLNAVSITADAVSRVMLYGRGAGMMPTGSAVVSDIVDIARNLLTGTTGRVPVFSYQPDAIRRIPILPVEEIHTHYYCRFAALDRPGVLSKISGILGDNGISIRSVHQKGRKSEGSVPIVMLTHQAREADVKKALSEITRLDIVSDQPVLIRIEDENGGD